MAQVSDDPAAALPADELIDFVDVFARPLPVGSISRVLGLSNDRRGDVRRWTDAASVAIGAQLQTHRWPRGRARDA